MLTELEIKLPKFMSSKFGTGFKIFASGNMCNGIATAISLVRQNER